MKIVCTSDSHNRLDVLQRIVEIHPNADMYLDAGDSQRKEFELDPFITVRGNCDYDNDVSARYRILIAKDIKIYLFHGDRALLSLDALSNTAKNNGCQMIIHGHTHVPHYSFHEGVHILCPGSVSLPRTRMGRTYALIDIDGNNVDVKITKVN